MTGSGLRTTSTRISALPVEKLALLARESRDRLKDVPGEPLAIVGRACRYPGGVSSPEDFWDLLVSGRSGVSEIPAQRWDVERYYDPIKGTPGKMYTRHGAFVDGVDTFDAEFFGISPREAAGMDPQQRLLLETAFSALDEAGAAVEPRSTSSIGVFVGIMNHDYAMLMSEREDPDVHTGSGNGLSVAAGRIAHAFGLRGPALAVDTACSSSLVALHLACRSLQSGEADMAVVGGVNVILSPVSTIVECQMNMLAEDGRCKAFDASADGFVRGEGCGVLVLKKLTDALRDRDRIHAVIRGSAVNHDGHSGALTVPNGPAQERVIRAALRSGGIDPVQVSYVEAHGTGTPLGDPIEATALARAYTGERALPLAIGSVKTNIGHTESAAGIASVFKAMLALEHGVIPPHLNLETPNPEVSWDELGLRIPVAAESWPVGSDRRLAGVSSFGFSGTNAHLVLEAAPSAAPVAPDRTEGPLLLPVSASSEGSLRSYSSALARRLDGAGSEQFAAICRANQVRRSRFRYRAVITASSSDEARERLGAVAGGSESSPGTAVSMASGARPRVAFLFTGNGSQYPGMGVELADAFDAARETFERCAVVAGPFMPVPLMDVLAGESTGGDLLDRADCGQPALYALQCAIAAVWRSLGVVPDLVIGHSTGEYAAAQVAGVFDLETGMRLTMERGRLMLSLPPEGGMLTCFADVDALVPHLAEFPTVSVAAVNAPGKVVVAAARSDLDDFASRLDSCGIGSRNVRVDRAYHSPATDVIIEPFADFASGLQFEPPRIPYASSLTGTFVDVEVARSGYWARHLRQPVRFAAAMGQVLARGVDACVEIGPKATLSGLAAAIAENSDPRRAPRLITSLRPGIGDTRAVVDAAGGLTSIGADLDWDALGPGGSATASLPPYPFLPSRHWAPGAGNGDDGFSGRRGGRAVARGRSDHPLLGGRLSLAGSKDRRYESEIGVNRPTFVRDHRLHGTAVLPGAATIELMLTLCREELGGSVFGLEDVEFRSPIVLPDAGLAGLQTVSVRDGDRVDIELFLLDDSTDEARWNLVATGRAVARTETPNPLTAMRNGDELDVDTYYDHFRAGGIEYGTLFRCIEKIDYAEGWSSARLGISSSDLQEPWCIHPVLLDGGMQAIGAALPPGDVRTWIPVGVAEVTVSRQRSSSLVATVSIRDGTHPSRLVADIDYRDLSGDVVAQLKGVRLAPVSPGSVVAGRSSDVASWLYEIAHEPCPRAFPSLPAELPSPAGLESIAAARADDGDNSVNSVLRDVVREIVVGRRPGAGLRIMEFGEAAGVPRGQLLPILPAGSCEYVLADDSAEALAASEREFADQPSVSTAVLDLTLDPLLQGQHTGRFEVVVATDAIGKASSVDVSLGHLRRLVSPGGLLILVENDLPEPVRDWRSLLATGGFAEVAALQVGSRRRAPGALSEGSTVSEMVIASLPESPVATSPRQFVILAGAGDFAKRFAELVVSRGHRCTTVVEGDRFGELAPDLFRVDPANPDDWGRLFGSCISTVGGGLVDPGRDDDFRGGTGGSVVEIVDVRGMDGGDGGDAGQGGDVTDAGLRELLGHLTSRALGLAPAVESLAERLADRLEVRVTIVTAGAIPVGDLQDPTASLLVGLAAAAESEMAHARFRSVDLDRSSKLGEESPDGVEAVEALYAELTALGEPGPVTFRKGSRYEARLRRWRAPDYVAGDIRFELRDGLYLITGGLKGLGLLTAEWASDRGATDLLLVGRSEAGQEAEGVIANLRSRGVGVSVLRADIGREEDFASIEGVVERIGQPMRGIFHCAGALSDALLSEHDRESFGIPFGAKVVGSWRLARLAKEGDLDCFVLFSSAASILGNPGQANHRIACGFEDALAHHLRGHGVPATSVNWGPWSKVGAAASEELLARLEARGMGAISPEEGLRVLDTVLVSGCPQLAVIPVDWSAVIASVGSAPVPPLLKALIADERAHVGRFGVVRRNDALIARLRHADSDEVHQELVHYLVDALGRIRGGAIAPGEKDLSLQQLGVDSLLAMELRNRMIAELDLDVPIARLVEGVSIDELAQDLAALMFTVATAGTTTGTTTGSAAGTTTGTTTGSAAGTTTGSAVQGYQEFVL